MWKSEVGSVHQNDFETVTTHYTVDYLSTANRDILVTEDGSWVARYVYDEDGTRISAEFDYADGTQRNTTNANGEYGENIASDIAVGDVRKVWYRTSLLSSTLFAVDESGEVIAHMMYDPWGNPLTETYTDTNFSGLDNLNNFTGYTWDETLRLYFAQNRFYDAENHRFTQEDPIKDGANWYVYCGNSPATNLDTMGLAYDMYITAYNNPYKKLAEGELKDTRYADRHYFALREVADIIDDISGYTAEVEYIEATNTAKLTVDMGTRTKTYQVSIGSMARGLWKDGYEVSNNGVYFTYYQCILKPTTFINVEDLADALQLIIIAEDQKNIAQVKNESKSYVIGAKAFSQLKWRINVSVGVCFDGTGDFGLLGGLSFGGGLVGAGVGGFIGIYNTPSINNLSGVSMEVGGGTAIPGATVGAGGFSWGVDKSFALTSPTFSGTIYSVSFGIGWPLDVHGQITATGVLNISEGFRHILRIIAGSNNPEDVIFNAN